MLNSDIITKAQEIIASPKFDPTEANPLETGRIKRYVSADADKIFGPDSIEVDGIVYYIGTLT